MAPTIAFPLDDSLLPFEAVRFHEQHNPSEPIFVFSNGVGITELTALEYSRGVQRVAKFLQPKPLDRPGEIIGLLASVDSVLYYTLVLGIEAARHIPFPMSTRNSPAAVVNLLNKTGCRHLLVTQNAHKSIIEGIKAEFPEPIKFTETPDFNLIYPLFGKETKDDAFTSYPPLPFKRSLDEVCIYLHSSGSTGHPKPIPETHRALLGWMKRSAIRLSESSTAKSLIAVPNAPPFHTMAIVAHITNPLCLVGTIKNLLFYPQAPAAPIVPTPEFTLQQAKEVEATALISVPFFLEAWAEDPEAVAYLSTLDWVATGGGPLGDEVGDLLISKGVRLSSVYGTTEFGLISTLPNGKVSPWPWNYFNFDYHKDSVKWIDRGEGRFEMEVVPSEHVSIAIVNAPDNVGYLTQDLFIEHPTLKNHWKIVGRNDDVIILGTGEKVVPVEMEGTILTHELVNGALYFGREKSQVGVLIEASPNHPLENEAQIIEFRNKIWPVIEEANRHAPDFGRIFKETIIVVNKPFTRSPKGTVLRFKTLNDFSDEIALMYETVEASQAGGQQIEDPLDWTLISLTAWLKSHAEDLKQHPIESNTDLFLQGFDSLSSTHLRNRIISALRRASDAKVQQASKQVQQNLVFAHPTIEELAQVLLALIEERDRAAVTATEAIEAMIAKYSTKPVLRPQLIQRTKEIVLVTGTTGSLGAHLLEALIRDERVETVFALNRTSSSSPLADRQKAAFEDRDFDTKLLLSPKLRVIEGDTSIGADLGLSNDVITQLRSSLTCIIHNAWRLDFNLSLASFEPNIRGSRNLIDLASAAQARFMFTSSVGSATGWDARNGPFPEDVQLDSSCAVGNGYGESKYVVERILAASGLHATSFRIGQITGGKNGAWATTDWVPNMIKTSVALGVLPESVGLSPWAPMTVMSGSIIDVAFAAADPPLALNLVHPRPVTWSKLISGISLSLKKAGVTEDRLLTVPLVEWFSSLSKIGTIDYEKYPALKLSSFFQSLVTGDEAVRASGVKADLVQAGGGAGFSTSKSEAACPTLAAAAQLGQEDIDSWIHYWRTKGLF